MNDDRASWLLENRRILSDSLRRITTLIARFADGELPDVEPVDDEGSALAMVRERFGLTTFESDVLVAAAGVELDGEVPSVCARANGDLARSYPTFSLALAAFPDGAWSSLGPTAPLRHWRLIDVDANPSLVSAQLRIDETILNVLTGTSYLDPRIAAVVEPPAEIDTELAPSQRRLVERMRTVWDTEAGTRSVIQLVGDDVLAKRSIAAALAASHDVDVLVIRASALPAGSAELDTVIRLCERHVVLRGGCALLECDDVEPGDGARDAAIARFIERYDGPLVVGTVHRRRGHVRPLLPFDVARPRRAEQRVRWQSHLGHRRNAVEQSGRLAAQFDFSFSTIDRACLAAGPRASEHALWESARALARPRLDELVERLDARAAWDDLVVPPDTRAMLERIVDQVRHRATVYDAWGFAASTDRGLGVTALFSGASGTGKTLAAEVIAAHVGIDLFRVDLSALVSKYIGETEKNLRRVFDAAESGGAILLFDEADALFGRRTEVKDSHDRYANVEVSYLLQRMEAYRGLAILTTNMRDALDPAFVRRLRFIVDFPFPDQATREAIWRLAFPADAPAQQLDPVKLARLSVTGGNIRSIALDAAFRAAAHRRPITMGDALEAARAEYRKLDRTLADFEIAGWLDPAAPAGASA
ncbi:MAG TPA: ATP-binding protein [Candidatus Elarobacter sp.]|nr:ATP-binding protein [Candidatus Elarobacter sp.]